MTRNYFKYLKNIVYRKQLSFLIVVLFSIVSFSQDKLVTSKAALAEKIYLQLDGSMYANDQDIWFKAVVVSAETHLANQFSKVLYVDLIGPDETVLEQKLVNITNGLGNNFFKLHKNYRQGRYLIRAYTEWGKNFGNDFVFKTYINIFSSLDSKTADPIKKIALIKDKVNNDFVNIDIDPLLIDSLHRRKLNIYIAYKDVRDSLVVKKSSNKNYQFSYEIPKNTNLLTVAIETENGVKFSKTVSLNNELLDVQFFPESGEMVEGILNKVGFKVINHLGKGIVIKGVIVDENDIIITRFGSNQFGMGTFGLSPLNGKKYFAKLINPDVNTKDIKYPLPDVLSNGSTLSILEKKEKIRISTFSNTQKSDRIFILVTSRGVAQYEIRGKLKKGRLTVDLPKNNLPEGIIAFTLLNKNKQPLAERLYFNELLGDRLNIRLSTKTKTYKQREKTTIDITALGIQEDSVHTDFSVLVINKELLGKTQNSRQNILSYLLLNSELKGKIENSSYYFDKENISRKLDLDALMLTQGWRKYKYNIPLNYNFHFKNEPRLNISGRIGVPFSKIKKEGMGISMAVFGEDKTFYSQSTDSLGYFNFQIADTYGERAKILVQNNDKKGKKKNYPIILKKKKALKIEYDYIQRIEKLDSIVRVVEQKTLENKKAVAAFNEVNGVIELDEVVLTERKLTPLQKTVTERYGEADVVIDGKEILSKEKKWSYGLYSVLLFNYPNVIEIEKFSDGFMLAHVVGGSREGTLMMIDGKLANDFNYDRIPHIPPSEVKSVEIIRYAKRFSLSYTEVFPDAHPLEIPLQGHIISIYTHGNVGLHAISKPRGQFKTSIPVFAVEKEFYSPKYETTLEKLSNKPDLRSLVFWKPHVKAIGNESSTVEFYNGDDLGDMFVIVEGISENGRIGYAELTYNVEEKD